MQKQQITTVTTFVPVTGVGELQRQLRKLGERDSDLSTFAERVGTRPHDDHHRPRGRDVRRRANPHRQRVTKRGRGRTVIAPSRSTHHHRSTQEPEP